MPNKSGFQSFSKHYFRLAAVIFLIALSYVILQIWDITRTDMLVSFCV